MGKQLVLHPVCADLMGNMRAAGIHEIFMVLRKGKWDIPAYLGNGNNYRVHLAYLIAGVTYGVPFTLDEAFPFVKEGFVALGFPDIVIHCETDFYSHLLDHILRHNLDAVLALFPTQSGQMADMVLTDRNGLAREIWVKPETTKLQHAWIAAVWGPKFTQFLHDWVQEKLRRHREGAASLDHDPELKIGNVVQDAIDSGLSIGTCPFAGTFLDIGTAEGLRTALAND